MSRTHFRTRVKTRTLVLLLLRASQSPRPATICVLCVAPARTLRTPVMRMMRSTVMMKAVRTCLSPCCCRYLNSSTDDDPGPSRRGHAPSTVARNKRLLSASPEQNVQKRPQPRRLAKRPRRNTILDATPVESQSHPPTRPATPHVDNDIGMSRFVCILGSLLELLPCPCLSYMSSWCR